MGLNGMRCVGMGWDGMVGYGWDVYCSTISRSFTMPAEDGIGCDRMGWNEMG
jgi:hypothetical protein